METSRIRARKLGVLLGSAALAGLPVTFVAVPAVAQQDCSSSNSPAPAAGKSFAGSGTRTPVLVLGSAQPGCAGNDGVPGGSGDPGYPGQASGPVTVTVTSGAVTGGSVQGLSFAGRGGDGGKSGANIIVNNNGGRGGAGGAGGDVTLSYSGSISQGGIGVGSAGRPGGQGGLALAGTGAHWGGDGGTGGSGGTVSATVSGTITAPSSAVSVSSGGAPGGNGGQSEGGLGQSTAGSGGAGGHGGTATATVEGTMQSAAGTAVAILAIGGNGGNGADAFFNLGNSVAGGGGAGGNGGKAAITVGGNVTSNGFQALIARSIGGNGGKGGEAQATAANAGSGGQGGAGGSASATIEPGAVLKAAGKLGTPGVLVQSNGGQGGAGGNAGAAIGVAGGGGKGGAAGTASASIAGSISTVGTFSHGAIVQSVGGSGLEGGDATGAFTVGGMGLSGGNGGPVSVTADGGQITTGGDGSIALLAQSIGGGGGSGGNALTISAGTTLGMAIGGNGGVGGDGAEVALDLKSGVFTSLSKHAGAGILAQSIGGAGGSAGNASSTGTGLQVAIGGDASGGGKAGNVTVENAGLVTTYGDHAVGIEAQSIGGGGGKGGAGVAYSASAILGVGVAVGGRGGSGGPAGAASVTNAFQVTTYGHDAAGVKVQSIGGGGGHGGTGMATAIALSPDPEIPAISAAVSVGGSGGSGNTGGPASIDNQGLVTTAGDGAFALLAQSVGGGGGTGGDSSSASFAGGASDINLSFNVAVGGSGGTGATGGAVDLKNEGMLLTFGQDAFAVFGQSVGGGGGAGGAGDTSGGAAEGEKFSLTGSVSVGGSGGTGGHGGSVTMTNDGGIATRGDGAYAVFAQSVGGGGGVAGGGVANAEGKLSASVGVGGSGGAAGNGGAVKVSNAGGIVTVGTDAIGVSAQSVGGGGGRAGKGGATAGGAVENQAKALFEMLERGLDIDEDVKTIADGVLQIGDGLLEGVKDLEKLKKVAGGEAKGEEGEHEFPEINLAVSVGGKGGAAGAGGAVEVSTTSQIATLGAFSDGIFAQSVGGGGGMGGAASSTGAESEDSPIQAAVGVGGSGGAGGDGGAVTVNAGAPSGAAVSTAGISAFGIAAQSVGGGGGRGAMAGAKSGVLKSVSVSVGGSGDVSGNGGPVTVTAPGLVTTTGKHGIGILAQSIGGGGGLMKVISDDEIGDDHEEDPDEDEEADAFNVNLAFGGNGSGGGSGGAVNVASSGGVQTAGRDAHGVLAQSIGGGGGIAVGGQATDAQLFFGGDGGKGGSGGNVTVTVDKGAEVATTGDGAVGVWAQSVGGGGGIGGDIALSVINIPIPTKNGGDGNGGTASVAVDGAAVRTSGDNAHAVVAQSIGGGGGVVTNEKGAYEGTAGGIGFGSLVEVSLSNGAVVAASGKNSSGIVGQSKGQGFQSSPIKIGIDGTSSVTGGTGTGAAVLLRDGIGNVVTNAGTISSAGQDPRGWAIFANTTAGTTRIVNTGTIIGGVHFSDSPGTLIDNRRGGVLEAGRRVELGTSGTLRNAGTLSIGGGGQVSTTVLKGDLEERGSGHLAVDVDPGAQRADLLDVHGRVTLRNSLEINPISLARTTLTVLTAADGVEAPSDLRAVDRLHLFSLDPVVSDDAVAIAIDADFTGAKGLTATSRRHRGIAEHLQALWDGGADGFGGVYADLARDVPDDAAYQRVLGGLSSGSVGALAAARAAAGQRMAESVFSCQTFAGDSMLLAERACGWVRVDGVDGQGDGTSAQPGYDWNAVTLTGGGQREIAPGWFVGGALGYETSSMSSDDGLLTSDGDAALAALSIKRHVGPLLFGAAVHLGHGWYDNERRIPIGDRPTAKSSPQSSAAGVHLRASWQQVNEGWYVQPALDLDATYVKLDGYTESGAGAYDLKVKSSDGVVLAATPSVRVGSRVDLAGGAVLNLHAGIGVSFYGGNDWDVGARFAAAPSSVGDFTSSFETPDTIGRLTTGIDLMREGALNVRGDVSAGFADGYSDYGGSLRLSWLF